MTTVEIPRRLSRRRDSELLAPDTGMGAVTLRVSDLDKETAFYRDGVLLTVLAEHRGDAGGLARVVLGRLGTPIVILEHAPELRHAGPREAGLYHVAVVFEHPSDLAAAVYSTAMRYPGVFAGSKEHFVGQAFYFTTRRATGSSCTGIAIAPNGTGWTAVPRSAGCCLTRTPSSSSTSTNQH
jgi:catechol 2,3-dioxygenase